jgi:hypothetical protein
MVIVANVFRIRIVSFLGYIYLFKMALWNISNINISSIIVKMRNLGTVLKGNVFLLIFFFKYQLGLLGSVSELSYIKF